MAATRVVVIGGRVLGTAVVVAETTGGEVRWPRA